MFPDFEMIFPSRSERRCGRRTIATRRIRCNASGVFGARLFGIVVFPSQNAASFASDARQALRSVEQSRRIIHFFRIQCVLDSHQGTPVHIDLQHVVVQMEQEIVEEIAARDTQNRNVFETDVIVGRIAENQHQCFMSAKESGIDLASVHGHWSGDDDVLVNVFDTITPFLTRISNHSHVFARDVADESEQRFAVTAPFHDVGLNHRYENLRTLVPDVVFRFDAIRHNETFIKI